MRAVEARALVVVERDGSVVGLVDEQLLAHLVFEAHGEEPVHAVLGTQPPPLIHHKTPIYVALSRLQGEDLARLVVVDEGGGL